VRVYEYNRTLLANIQECPAPNRWISSITTSATLVTYARDCQLRLIPSHFSGVATV